MVLASHEPSLWASTSTHPYRPPQNTVVVIALYGGRLGVVPSAIHVPYEGSKGRGGRADAPPRFSAHSLRCQRLCALPRSWQRRRGSDPSRRQVTEERGDPSGRRMSLLWACLVSPVGSEEEAFTFDSSGRSLLCVLIRRCIRRHGNSFYGYCGYLSP